MSAWLVLIALLPQESYLPLKEGTRLTYVVESVGAEASDPAREVVAEVDSRPRAGESDWVSISNFLGYASCWMRSTAAGIDFKLENRAEAPSMTLLKAHAQVGDAWTGRLGTETLTFSFRGEESLDQGDRQVQALHVEFTGSARKRQAHDGSHGHVWFAAGLGIVRAELTTDLDCHTSLTRVYELKPLSK